VDLASALPCGLIEPSSGRLRARCSAARDGERHRRWAAQGSTWSPVIGILALVVTENLPPPRCGWIRSPRRYGWPGAGPAVGPRRDPALRTTAGAGPPGSGRAVPGPRPPPLVRRPRVPNRRGRHDGQMDHDQASGPAPGREPEAPPAGPTARRCDAPNLHPAPVPVGGSTPHPPRPWRAPPVRRPHLGSNLRRTAWVVTRDRALGLRWPSADVSPRRRPPVPASTSAQAEGARPGPSRGPVRHGRALSNPRRLEALLTAALPRPTMRRHPRLRHGVAGGTGRWSGPRPGRASSPGQGRCGGSANRRLGLGARRPPTGTGPGEGRATSRSNRHGLEQTNRARPRPVRRPRPRGLRAVRRGRSSRLRGRSGRPGREPKPRLAGVRAPGSPGLRERPPCPARGAGRPARPGGHDRVPDRRPLRARVRQAAAGDPGRGLRDQRPDHCRSPVRPPAAGRDPGDRGEADGHVRGGPAPAWAPGPDPPGPVAARGHGAATALVADVWEDALLARGHRPAVGRDGGRSTGSGARHRLAGQGAERCAPAGKRSR
jgi:hypothetical protein